MHVKTTLGCLRSWFMAVCVRRLEFDVFDVLRVAGLVGAQLIGALAAFVVLTIKVFL